MNIKAFLISTLAVAMLSAQACAGEGVRDGAYGGMHHGMGMHEGMGMHDGMGMHGEGHAGRGHHGGGYGMRGSNLMAMAKFKGIHRLGLSDDQYSKFRDIKHQLKKDLWQLMGKMIDVKYNLRKVWEVDKPDAAKVGAAYKDMFDLQRQAIELRVKARNKIYDMLTAEQRQQFGRGHGGHHHGGGHHGGSGSM